MVFVCEDGEEDAFHGGSVGEDAHGSGPAPDFAEAAFDGICRSGPFAPGGILVSEAGQQFVEIVSQAIDGVLVRLGPASGEGAGGLAGGKLGVGIDDLVQAALDGVVVGGLDLVQEVADLVRPAALHRDLRVDQGERGEQALAAACLREAEAPAFAKPASAGEGRSLRRRQVDGDQLEAVSGEPAAVEVVEEGFPGRRALGPGQAKVDDLLAAVRA